MNLLLRSAGVLLILLAWSSAVARAAFDAGPSSSPSQDAAIYPASGAWSDPASPGSGFMLEVQGGVMAGGWFGYTPAGSAEWRVFSGMLENRSTAEGSRWALVATTFRFTGGACFGCAHVAPRSERAESIELEFTGSHAGRYRVLGASEPGAWRPIQSTNFGSDITILPDAAANTYIAPLPSGHWVFVFEQIAPPLYGRQPESKTYTLGCSADESGLPWCIVAEVYPAELLIVGELECDLAPEVRESPCEISGLDHTPDGYRILLKDLGDARLGGVSFDGRTRLHGFRLKYD